MSTECSRFCREWSRNCGIWHGRL